MKLSVIIPFYNEEATVAAVIQRVRALALPLEVEIIAVDDGSTDAGPALAAEIPGITLLRHGRNRGKGAAVRTGLASAGGDFIVIQDADLELDPAQIPSLIAPLLAGSARVVYGSRNLVGTDQGRTPLFYLGGILVTRVANLLYGTRLTDEVCGFKAFRAGVLEGIALRCDGFAWEEEFTAKISRRGIPIHEIAVTCRSRSMKQGKKLRRRDGVKALWVLLKHRFAPSAGGETG
jgi:dolichol-phosphate mannosyltransferase